MTRVLLFNHFDGVPIKPTYLSISQCMCLSYILPHTVYRDELDVSKSVIRSGLYATSNILSPLLQAKTYTLCVTTERHQRSRKGTHSSCQNNMSQNETSLLKNPECMGLTHYLYFIES